MSKLPLFRTTYDGLQPQFSHDTSINFTIPKGDDDADYHPSRSLTVQSDAADLDINNIMARYLKTGVAPLSRAAPFYGDATALPDFMQAQQILIDAQLAFESLPARVRDRFHNDPARFLEFMGDESNQEEALALGLLEARDAAVSSERPQKAGVEEAAPAPTEGQE